jgi:hypothetical protein
MVAIYPFTSMAIVCIGIMNSRVTALKIVQKILYGIICGCTVVKVDIDVRTGW